MFKKAALALVILLLGGTAFAQQGGEVFAMDDPQGDSFGPGQYTYPGDQTFPQELPDMVDLVQFRVVNGEGSTRYEFHFAQSPSLVQPWGGAGCNFHRIDLYIADGGKGTRSTFRPGAQVQFKEPWQVNLRIRDWQGAYLLFWEDDPEDKDAGIWQGETEDFDVFVEGSAIIAEIGHDILEPAAEGWQYYVLVGLQDAYGDDHYRSVADEQGPWNGGGGSETEFSPNVYDILAADADSQRKQLDWAPGRLAKLAPVGNVGSKLLRYLLAGAVALGAAGVAILIRLFKKR